MDFGIYSLYSNLIDTKIRFCSLCFKIVKEDAACIQDSVILILDEDDPECSNNEEVDIQYILQEVLGDQTASYLSENDAICDKCTRSAISSYKFIKMCRRNMKSMATAVDLFTTTTRNRNVDFGDRKTLFLSMNFQDSTCIQYFDKIKFKNNKSALTRFQYLFRSFELLTDAEGNTMYKCTKCPASYPKVTSARRHFTAKHIDDPDAKKEAQNMDTVSVGDSLSNVVRGNIKHDNDKSHTVIKDSDGKNKYQCKSCPTVCSSAASARRHYELTHAQFEKSPAARLRPRVTKDYISYLNEISYVEMTDVDGTTKYQCTECVTFCSNIANARRHFKTTHMEYDDMSLSVKKKTIQQEPPNCTFCHEKFENKYVLTKHILQEHSIEAHEDITGIEADNNIFNYVYTVVKDDNECEKWRCKVCGKLYKNYTIVTTHFKKQHLNVHEIDQPFICSHCGKECKDQYALKRHEEHHTLRMTCPTCNKVYKSRVCFKQHVCFRQTARSDMRKDVICDYCGKSFVSKTSLRIHVRYRHGPESQRYQCQHCPKTFGAYSHWKAHQVKHTRERNFTCDTCGNVFVTQMALVYHTRIHTGERPFECKYCDMKFLSSSRRAHHIKRHHIAEMATCDVCGVTVKAVGMNKHKRRHNNAESTLYIGKDGGSARKAQGAKASVKKIPQQLIYDHYVSDSQ